MGGGGPHSLAFRVMPFFQVDPIPLLLDPADLLVGEDIFDDPIASQHLPPLLDCHVSSSSDPSYCSRFLLQRPLRPPRPPSSLRGDLLRGDVL